MNKDVGPRNQNIQIAPDNRFSEAFKEYYLFYCPFLVSLLLFINSSEKIFWGRFPLKN